MTDNESSTNRVNLKANSNWALGLAVVFIGGLLLIRNLGIELGIFRLDHWWAIFILVAALGPLARAYKLFSVNGWNLDVANSLVSALAIVTLGLLILLELSLAVWWPMLLIIGGFYMMTNRKL